MKGWQSGVIRHIKIEEIRQSGQLWDSGVRTGQLLCDINDKSVRDRLDFLFYSSDDIHSLTIIRDGKKERITFNPPLAGIRDQIEVEDLKPFRCNNQCIFCFIDQLPGGLRSTLYFKDEDYRLSFLCGNYITGTNLKDEDITRIIQKRLKPLYFSVHAVDPEIRRNILQNKKAPPILPLLNRLKDEGISYHTQIVLMPGINDGNVLRESVHKLAALYPATLSIAIVPVGLTSHRSSLQTVEPVTAGYSRNFINEMKSLTVNFEEEYGERILYLSDEFYLLAEKEPPSYNDLDFIPQLENGVGMTAEFYRGFEQRSKDFPARIDKPRHVALLTAPLGAIALHRFRDVMNMITGLNIELLTVTNTLLGSSITVSGLMSGRDVLDTIRANPGFDLYLLPANCINPDGLFLDDYTVSMISEETGRNLEICPCRAVDVASRILE